MEAEEEVEDDDEDAEDPAVPGRVELPGGVSAVQVVAGDGFTFVLGDAGAVYGCGMFKDDVGGLSGFSQVGSGAGSSLQKTFVPVYEPATAAEHVVKLVSGARHVVALTEGGSVLTWGIGSQGQLGRLPAYDQFTQPRADKLFVPLVVHCVDTLLGGSPIANIGCGAYNTFVVAASGAVVGWGLNNSGQLGLPRADEAACLEWAPLLVPSLEKIANIHGGEQHTLALTQEGTVLSFGASTYGMLGRAGVDVDTANTPYPDPAVVAGLDGLKVVSIAAGMNVSGCCTSDGTAWLWGSNVNYQLAKGEEEEDSLVPEKLKRTKVFGWRKVYSISFGGQHAALLAGPQEAAPPPSDAAVVAATVHKIFQAVVAANRA